MPYSIRSKVILQELWSEGYEWDEPVKTESAKKAEKWLCELSELNSIKVPRCVRPNKNISKKFLHVFCDASSQAYGAVAYLVCEYKSDGVDHYTSVIAAANSRAAPLKSLSIPRLELMAALMGARLTSKIYITLDIPISSTILWSDSMDTLHWIQGHSRKFKTFVANRVAEIQTITEPLQWRYIPTKENPADILSCGMSVKSLCDSQMWWSGPDFLKNEKSNWPKNSLNKEVMWLSQTETRTITMATVDVSENRLDPSRYSNLNHLIRITALSTWFIDNCKLPRELRAGGSLQVVEIQDAEMILIRQAQKDCFFEEIDCIMNKKDFKTKSSK